MFAPSDLDRRSLSYEFTTLTTVPGVIQYKGAKIQMLDLPGIIEGAKDGKGRGRQVIAVARTCSLIFIVLDVLKPLTDKRIIERELEGFGIRLNKQPPDITIKKKDRGGITLTSMLSSLTYLDLDQVRAILSEYKISNADVTLRCDATVDDLIDVIEGNRKYIPALYVLNKIDQISIEELDIVYKIPHAVPISAHHGWNFDDLLEKMWEYLDLVRVYTKPKGQLPDYSAPIVLTRAACTVEDLCNSIHKTLLKQFKHALVWGSSVKYNPQKVGKDHSLRDEDVVQVMWVDSWRGPGDTGTNTSVLNIRQQQKDLNGSAPDLFEIGWNSRELKAFIMVRNLWHFSIISLGSLSEKVGQTLLLLLFVRVRIWSGFRGRCAAQCSVLCNGCSGEGVAADRATTRFSRIRGGVQLLAIII